MQMSKKYNFVITTSLPIRKLITLKIIIYTTINMIILQSIFHKCVCCDRLFI